MDGEDAIPMPVDDADLDLDLPIVVSKSDMTKTHLRWGRSARAAELVKQGMPVQQAARQERVAPNVLRAYLRRHQIPIPPPSHDESKGARASALVDQGMSINDACVEVGCTYATCWRWRKQHGLT